MRATPTTPKQPASASRAANLRTAAILVSVAFVFFGGIIASQYTGGNAVGMAVVGFAIIGLLLLAVARNVRARGTNAATRAEPKARAK